MISFEASSVSNFAKYEEIFFLKGLTIISCPELLIPLPAFLHNNNSSLLLK
jgi:hypothetical protein